MLTKTLISLLVAATVTPALAGPAEDLDFDLGAYRRATEGFVDYWSESLDERWPEGGCHALLAKAQGEGVTPTADQTKLCDEFKKYHQLAEAQKAVLEAQRWNYFLTQINMATNHEENGAKMATAAAECTATVDRLAAAGMPMNIKVRISTGGDGLQIEMKDAKAKVCAPLTKAAGSFAKNVSSARTEAYEKAAAPYKKVGITGERLELLANHINYAMYGVGGNELRTPQQLKNAKVIFELLGPGTDGLYTLRRYQFAGDKIVSTTSREFLLRPGAKFFK